MARPKVADADRRVPVPLRLPASLVADFDSVAVHSKRTRVQAIEQLVAAYVEQQLRPQPRSKR